MRNSRGPNFGHTTRYPMYYAYLFPGVRDVCGWVQVHGDEQPLHEPLGATETGTETKVEADAASSQ